MSGNTCISRKNDEVNSILKFSKQTPWYKRMKALRINDGLTQYEIAEKIGVPPRSYQRWEGGLNIPIGIYRQAIAQGFGVPENTIFYGEVGRKSDYQVIKN